MQRSEELLYLKEDEFDVRIQSMDEKVCWFSNVFLQMKLMFVNCFYWHISAVCFIFFR